MFFNFCTSFRCVNMSCDSYIVVY
uniref:Uncharacterized protein n=1 Tax=Anguilla anguilla TaxID=7936 RepID=A0A0E9Q6Z2_ANGAN